MLDLQSHFLFDFLEALDCKFKVFLAVSCGDLRTDARLAHGHNGVAEAYYIHALFKHARGKFLRSAGIVKHNGHYWVRAGQHIEAKLAELTAEEGRVLMHLVAQCGGGGEHLQHLQAGGAYGRGKRIAEKIRPAALPE